MLSMNIYKGITIRFSFGPSFLHRESEVQYLETDLNLLYRMSFVYLYRLVIIATSKKVIISHFDNSRRMLNAVADKILY